jgi:hypothetical protein
MSQIFSRISLSAIVATALALSACGGGSTPPPPPPAKPPVAAPAPAPAPAPAAEPAAPAAAPAAAVTVSSVTLGNAVGADGKIPAPTTNFGPKDTIYAVIQSKTANPNTVVTARWTYQGGQLVKEDAQTLAGAGDNVTTLHISKPDGWPVGNYSLDLMVDGKSVSTTPFTVK